MTRAIAFALLAAGVASASAPRADVEVAPPPREVRADGTRDPAPTPEPKEDPLAVVERIIKNSKDVGDKLAMTDTGADTRKTQAKILKDIDALLNQDDPPPKSDMNKDMNDMNKDMKDKNDKNDDKKDMTPMGGMGGGNDKKDGKPDMMPMGGMGQQPMGGTDDQPKERRPRRGGDQKQQAQPKDPGKGGMGDMRQPMGGAPKEPPKNPGGGKLPDQQNGNPPPNPLLPHEEDVVRDVWGHLPDKLRQQATQYYKQEFMPRYTELLKLYYSSLSEKK